MLKVTRYFLELKSNEIEIGKVDLPQNVSIFINEKKNMKLISSSINKLEQIITGEIDWFGQIKSG